MSLPAFDAVVLGGGPAGCTAALALRRAGRSVALLERSRYDDDRVGETLAPEVGLWLSRLGVLDESLAVPGCESPGVVSLWGGAEVGEFDFLRHPYGPGRHVDRQRFDAALADAAVRAGAVLFRATTPREARPDADGWTVTGSSRGEPTALRSRWAVDATGRAGWLARRQGARPERADGLVAVVARVEGLTGPDGRLVLEAVPDGWWYLSPLPGGRAVAAFLTDSDLLPPGAGLRPFWERQQASSRLVGPRFRGPERGARLRVVAASARWAGSTAGPLWLAAGDAAVAYDPLSGSGVWRALASGLRAAEAIRASEGGDPRALLRYQSDCEAEFQSHLAARSRVYSTVDDWPDRPFWRRRLNASSPAPTPEFPR